MLQFLGTSDIVRQSLLTLYTGVADFIPRFVAAVVVFLIGWLIASLLGKAAYHIIRTLQIDKALDSLGFKRVWERGGMRLNTPLFFEGLIKWFFIVVFLMAATNIIGLDQVTDFLQTVVFYLPNVIVAAFVMLIGVLVARFIEHSVRVSVRTAQLASANFLALLARWAILIFAFLVALDQLSVASEIIRIFVIGVVTMAAIGGGLAFGLGGQRHAEEWLSGLKRKVQD